jgi:hypothetical protein
MSEQSDEKPEERSPVLDRINAALSAAGMLLDGAAQNIVSSPLDTERNVRRIAEVLMKISEIQDELYELEPELVPLFLRDTKRWKPYFDKRR